MSLITQLRKHAAHAVVTWRQRAAYRALAPLLYEAHLRFTSERGKPWPQLDEDITERWERRALAVLKVAAEQERQTAQAARDREMMDALVREAYQAPAAAALACPPREGVRENTCSPSVGDIGVIRTVRGPEDFETRD